MTEFRMGPDGLEHLCSDCSARATRIVTFTTTPPISRFYCDTHVKGGSA